METVPLNVAANSATLALTLMVAAYLYMNRCIVVQTLTSIKQYALESILFFLLKQNTIHTLFFDIYSS